MDGKTRDAIHEACLAAAEAMGPRLRTMSWFGRSSGRRPVPATPPGRRLDGSD